MIPISKFENTRSALVDTGLIQIVDDIDIETVVPICDAIIACDRGVIDPDFHNQNVEMHIHTSGGSLNAAMHLIDIMEAADTEVITVALGKTSSAGFLIWLAGDIRLVGRNTTILCHKGSMSIEHLEVEPHQFAEMNLEWQRNITQLETFIKSKIAHENPEEIMNIIWQDRDIYISAEQAIAYGLADGYYHERYQLIPQMLEHDTKMRVNRMNNVMETQLGLSNQKEGTSSAVPE